MKKEKSTIDYDSLKDEYICPICKCERFKNRNLLCEHIMICDKNNPDNPVIINNLNYIKTEDLSTNQSTSAYVLISRNILKERVVDNNIKKEYGYPHSGNIDMDAVSVSDDTSGAENDVIPMASVSVSKDNLKMKIKRINTSEQKIIPNATNGKTIKSELSVKPIKLPLKIKKSSITTLTDKVPIKGNDTLTCMFCSKTPPYLYQSRVTLIRHLIRFHNHASKSPGGLRQCRFCNSHYAKLDELLDHYLQCQLVPGNQISNQSVEMKPVRNNYFRCCMCFENTDFLETAFLQHMLTSHCLNKAQRFPKQKRQCIDCGTFISSFKTLFEHCKNCAGVRPIKK